jgi:lycopene beta-cyclase
LVVDKAPKDQNDHTWCFWENQPGLFEPVVHHQWQQVYFFSNHFSGPLDLAPYNYKMIRSLDFYNFVREEASKHANVSFIYGKVEAVGNEGQRGLVIVDGVRYTADYIFNSILLTRPLFHQENIICFSTSKVSLLKHVVPNSILQQQRSWILELAKTWYYFYVCTSGC